MSFFQFLRGRIPLDDNNLANAKVMGPLQPMDLIGYRQFRVRRPFNELSVPQLFVNQAWFQQGLGGLVSGSVVMQNLTQNPNGQ